MVAMVNHTKVDGKLLKELVNMNTDSSIFSEF